MERPRCFRWNIKIINRKRRGILRQPRSTPGRGHHLLPATLQKPVCLLDHIYKYADIYILQFFVSRPQDRRGSSILWPPFYYSYCCCISSGYREHSPIGTVMGPTPPESCPHLYSNTYITASPRVVYRAC